MGLSAWCRAISVQRGMQPLVVSRTRREAQHEPGKGCLEQSERAQREQKGASPGENGGEQDQVG
jgi:hypothetical protein